MTTKAKTTANDDTNKYSVIEDRTYTCLANDKSVSLNDLTPQNISKTNYWKYMQYNVNWFVMILEDSDIPADPNYTRPDDLEDGAKDPNMTPLYTKGIYKCIAIDYDIKIALVKYYTSQPTKLAQDPANKALNPTETTPCCFGKYVDVLLTDITTQRVNIALQKWQKVADLPTS